MLDRQRLARHVPASALLLATTFLALSLAGYDPADAPGTAAQPPNSPPSNPCGPVGAALAHARFVSVGWSSFLVLFSVLGYDILMFRRRSVPDKALRGVGLALLVAVAAALAQRFMPGIRPRPPVGTGGYLGALVASFL